VSPDGPIHVIDDDDAMRDSLRFLLQSSGFDTRTYGSAEAFLDRQEPSGEGCIVTDIACRG
jgi:two-component system response regulator FixJ